LKPGAHKVCRPAKPGNNVFLAPGSVHDRVSAGP
jgi:hypothetical protein